MANTANHTAHIRQANARRFVRKRELLSILPFSAATLHRKIRAGEFVTPIKLSERITAYDLSAVEAWLASGGKR